MGKCDKCNTQLLLKKKFYEYPGLQKGSLELTTEKIYCKKCFDKLYPLEDANIEYSINLIKDMTGKKYKDALKKINKSFNKKSKMDWYNKGNILQNLNKEKVAISCYDEALYLDTHYIKAWYRKGQTLINLKKYADAGTCFENVATLEKYISKKYTVNVKATKNGFSYELNSWILCAIFMRALVYMKEKKFDNADMWFSILYGEIGKLPPFDLIDSNLFIEYCVKNADQLLDSLEPKIIVEISPIGCKH